MVLFCLCEVLPLLATGVTATSPQTICSYAELAIPSAIANTYVSELRVNTMSAVGLVKMGHAVNVSDQRRAKVTSCVDGLS